MNGRSPGDRKKTLEKKNRDAFSPDGPNRARLRHAAVTCEAADERVPSYFVGGNPRSRTIIVCLSLSLSFSLFGGAENDGKTGRLSRSS